MLFSLSILVQTVLQFILWFALHKPFSLFCFDFLFGACGSFSFAHLPLLPFFLLTFLFLLLVGNWTNYVHIFPCSPFAARWVVSLLLSRFLLLLLPFAGYLAPLLITALLSSKLGNRLLLFAGCAVFYLGFLVRCLTVLSSERVVEDLLCIPWH